MTFKRVTEVGTVYVCAAPVYVNEENEEIPNAVEHGSDGTFVVALFEGVALGVGDSEGLEVTLTDGKEHVPAGRVHAQNALVHVAVVAAPAARVVLDTVEPVDERRSTTHPAIVETSAAMDGAYGAEPAPVLAIDTRNELTLDTIAKSTRSQGLEAHAHCAQQPPLTPAACHDVVARPSMARDANCKVRAGVCATQPQLPLSSDALSAEAVAPLVARATLAPDESNAASSVIEGMYVHHAPATHVAPLLRKRTATQAAAGASIRATAITSKRGNIPREGRGRVRFELH